MLWWLMCVAAALWAAAAAWRGRRVRRAAAQFRSDLPTWPLLGHAYLFIGSGEDRMKAISMVGEEALKQGGLSAIWLGQQFILVLADAENADLVLKSCLEKDQTLMRFTQLATGNGLIFAPVRIWRPRRKVVAPIFSQKTLNGFVRVFERQSAVLAERLRPAAGGADFSVWKHFAAFTFDSVCGKLNLFFRDKKTTINFTTLLATMMGIKLNAQYVDHPFLDAFKIGSDLIAERIMQPWLHNDLVYKLLPHHKKLHDAVNYVFHFVDEIVEAKRKELAEQKNSDNGDGARTFLEMLIAAGGGEEGFTNVELREEVLTMLMAGTDTSAVGACFTALLLARHPRHQEAIHQEITEVLGDRILTFEDLPKLKHLEAFIKESLRLYPPVPVTTREAHQDVTLTSGETVVAGMTICLHIWAMHRNPRYWGADAGQFRPGRFLEVPLQHPAQFMPFSYGMRNCIGYQYAMMSMKTVLATLVRRYRVLPPAALPAAELTAPLPVKYEIMMKHTEDFLLRLEPRC